MEENKILYDWLTFSTRIHEIDGVIDLLGLQDVSWIELDKGMNGYPRCKHFGGISICYGGREDMGICVCMSGSGCRSFETHGSGDYQAIFEEVRDNPQQMNISRLDVAYDDFIGLLDIDVVAAYVTKHSYVSRATKWSVTISDDGLTCGIGSMKSDTYIRIYDKKAERGREDLDHWVRCEIQLRGDCALGFLALGGSIGRNFFGVINNYLRFVDPPADGSDTNMRRWETAEWWSAFLECLDVVQIASKPGTEYNMSKLQHFVFNQCSGAVHTMIDIIGVRNFFKELREHTKLAPKYKDLKNQMGESTDSILDYLRERGAL